jgi:DNA-binding MarR family transcriptional regulator
MPLAEEKRSQFIGVMFNLVKSLKRETEICCKLCGPVSEKELFILVFVGQNESVTMSELASNLEAPLSTLTSIVDKLVDKKYLLRGHSDEDRRVVNVALTAKGKESYKIFLRQKRLMAEKVLAQLNEKEQNSMLQTIGSLAASIDGAK